MTDMPQDADPAASFAALMGAAAEQADTEAAEAPYGYTKDAESGEMRPKKAAGRPRRSPSLDELKAEREEVEAQDAPPVPPGASDRAPEAPKRSRPRGKDKPSAPAPPYKAGVITTGINRLYRRTGKLIRAMDEDIGEAFIQAARNTADPGEPDDSVGAAWDELAKTNPRVRKFLMKLIAGGAVGQLVMAHAPIGMAIVMKPAVLKRIPFSKVIESMAEADEDTPAGEGGLPGGMTAGDAAEMAHLAEQQVRAMGLQVSPEVMEQMARAAEGMVNGSGPPVMVRTQPRRPASRAKRH